MNQPPLLVPIKQTVRENATVLKLLLVALLVGLLLVPLSMVERTLRERLARHDAAVASITQAWGKSQRLFGPVLVVPYTFKQESDEWTNVTAPDGRRTRERVVRTVAAEALLLPEQLDVRGALESSERARGIYRTNVYAATLRIAGRFAPPDLSALVPAGSDVQWTRSRVGVAISDLRGTRETLTLRWGDADLPLQTGARLEGFGSGLHAPIALAKGGAGIDFALELTLNGSGALTMVPSGRKTSVQLSSPWPDPGFLGAFLPVQREIGAAGFDATWQVSHYGRDFPQLWATQGGGPAPSVATIEASAFGVSLMRTVTPYRTVERAIKYGVLFLALLFATFFLFETVCAVRLKALNYLLVGAALCLFYLGLLSLAEFIGFVTAYVGAAAASVGMIGLYSWSVLHSARRAALVAVMLSGVYGYLYFVLQMEDFALLAGTTALFALLAAVMYATRRLDRGDDVATAAATAART
ncbi:MAG: cell envelope integrity protein CreD [Opitutaceae bacterium]|nr:cell envelope integrity protein CreD [Opitutaceae bacterium]